MKKILFPFFLNILFFCSITPAFLQCEYASTIDPYPYSFKASNPSIMIDSLDNITCIWESSDGGNPSIEGMTAAINTGFSPAEGISVLGQNAQHPQIASGVFREAIAVWESFDGKNHVIQTSIRPFGKDWEKPITLSNPTENAYDPKIVAGKGGEVVAVWKSFDGENFVIQSALQMFDSEWGDVLDLSEKGCHADHPEIAINPSGIGVAIWELQCGDRQFLIQSATLTSDGRWGEPKNLIYSLENYSTARNPQIAIMDSGEAIAVWQLDFADGSSVIQSSIMPVNGNWSAPFVISPPDKKSVNPKIAVSPQGEAIIVWQFYDGGNRMVIQSRAKGIDGQWSGINEIFQTKCLNMDIQIAFTPSGDAIVIWTLEYREGSSAIYYSTKKFNESWKPSSKLTESRFKASQPQLVMDTLNHFYAIWQIKDANGDCFTQFSDHIFFTLPDSSQPPPTLPPAISKPLPAQEFKGKLVTVGSKHKQYTHALTWKPSPDHDVKWYKLYRNGKQIAKISHQQPLRFIVNGVRANEKVEYSLIAINSKGDKSDPLKFSFPKDEMTPSTGS